MHINEELSGFWLVFLRFFAGFTFRSFYYKFIDCRVFFKAMLRYFSRILGNFEVHPLNGILNKNPKYIGKRNEIRVMRIMGNDCNYCCCSSWRDSFQGRSCRPAWSRSLTCWRSSWTEFPPAPRASYHGTPNQIVQSTLMKNQSLSK